MASKLNFLKLRRVSGRASPAASGRLRIAAVLESRPEDGGAFQQALNDLARLKRLTDRAGDRLIVVSLHGSVNSLLRDLQYEVLNLHITLADYAFYILQLTTIFQFAQKILTARSPFEKQLVKRGVNLVYFLNQSKLFALIEECPYIITVFDNCHRDAPEFPEVRAYGESQRREWFYRNALAKAVLVVVNSDSLAQTLTRRYGVDLDRSICLPFEGAPEVMASSEVSSDGDILLRYGLGPGFLFYPAQFWSHKNHRTLIRALEIVRGRGRPDLVLALCGADKGALQGVRDMVGQMDMEAAVSILGFVPSSHLSALYRNAAALVMPTYFGPTNLPPIEAWMCNTPVVYPSAFADDVGDAAVQFDFDDAVSLAAAIEAVLEPSVRYRVTKAASSHLEARARALLDGERVLGLRLDRIRTRLENCV